MNDNRQRHKSVTFVTFVIFLDLKGLNIDIYIRGESDNYVCFCNLFVTTYIRLL